MACEASVAVGALHTCSLLSSGGVQCWGANNAGQLGNNSTIDSHVPSQVFGLASVVQAVAAGGLNSCALKDGGGVQCWGRNDHGQLGNNNTTWSNTPVTVLNSSGNAAFSDAMAITIGGMQTCALMSNSSVQCWGWNDYGQLGNNSTTDSHIPVVVLNSSGSAPLSGATAISAGGAHTCALVNGGVQCWGFNVSGELGNNSNIGSNIPVTVLNSSGNAPLSGVVTIAAGGWYTCALLDNGGVQCWGSNRSGRLGNNSTIESHIPVAVQF